MRPKVGGEGRLTWWESRMRNHQTDRQKAHAHWLTQQQFWDGDLISRESNSESASGSCIVLRRL